MTSNKISSVDTNPGDDDKFDARFIEEGIEEGIEVAKTILRTDDHSIWKKCMTHDALIEAISYYLVKGGEKFIKLYKDSEESRKTGNMKEWKTAYLRQLVKIVCEHEKEHYEAYFQTMMYVYQTEGGYANGKMKLSPTKYLKKQYKQAKKKEAQPVCHCCGKVAPSGTKLMKCSQCLSVSYCCQQFQVTDWKNGHKKECQELMAKRDSNSRSKGQNALKASSGFLPWIPFTGIAVDGSMVGLPGEFLCEVPLWTLDQGETCGLRDDPQDLVDSIRYFFKWYHISAEAASEITVMDKGILCQHVVALYWTKYPGLRQIEAEEGSQQRDKFVARFGTLTPVPENWKKDSMDSERIDFLPLGQRMLMDRGIDIVRAHYARQGLYD